MFSFRPGMSFTWTTCCRPCSTAPPTPPPTSSSSLTASGQRRQEIFGYKIIAYLSVQCVCFYHFIFQMISNTIGKFLSEKVIREKFGSIQSNEVTTFMMSDEFEKRKSESLPDLKVEFLDFNSILSKHNATIQEMKKYFGPNNKTVWITPGDLRYNNEQ